MSSKKIDPYQILGVTSATTQEDLKKTYHKLSKLYHPDVTGTHDCEQKFKEINEAYRSIIEERARETPEEETLRKKYKEYVGKKQEIIIDILFTIRQAQNEEQNQSYEQKIYEDIFGEKYEDDPSAFVKEENNSKRKKYEETIKNFKNTKRVVDEKIYQEFHQTFSRYDQTHKGPSFVQTKIEKDDYHEVKQKDNHFKLYATAGIYLYFQSPLQEKKLSQQQINKLRDQHLEQNEQKKVKIKNLFSDINQKMLKYPTSIQEPDAFDLLMKLTIYPDLKFWAVPSELFYKNYEQELLKSKGNFKKILIKNQRVNLKITHALEAERVLQNIFVPVSEVLKQLEEKGRYEPPGIFMKYYGYLYFRIRKKPIIIENLKSAKDYISLFDLFIPYMSPVPYYHNVYNEFKLFSRPENRVLTNLTGNEKISWIGNAYLNSKSIPKIYLQGDVKNIFIHRPDKTSLEEQRYEYVWGKYYER